TRHVGKLLPARRLVVADAPLAERSNPHVARGFAACLALARQRHLLGQSAVLRSVRSPAFASWSTARDSTATGGAQLPSACQSCIRKGDAVGGLHRDEADLN